MGRYVFNRLLWMIFILIGVAILIFTILYLVPGDVSTHFLGESATIEDRAAFNHKYGLDQPYLAQLGNFLYSLFLKGDFGTSFKYNTPVIEELLVRIPRTLFLGVSCIVVNALIGIPLGMMAALHQNKWQDTLCMVLALLFVSVPNFWLALEMVDLFAIRLGWFPPFGIDKTTSWVMPIIAGSMAGVAANARQTRSSMLEVIRADFITTARAKGVDEGIVVRRHMLPNALIPVVTGLGVGPSKSIAGNVVIERIFTIPGVGTYMLSGIDNYDYPIVRSSVVILAVFSSLVMLLVDIVYAIIDPRIKAQYSGKAKGK
ncbi:MAG: ABC transporter permease [Oscillospiraceae bacterium]|nr:ABC transporter permease [Oscillospiraceae bacterium]